MSITSRVTFFELDATKRLKNATSLFGAQFDEIATPYFSFSHQAGAIHYLVYNNLKVLLSVPEVVKGCLLLLGSLIENPTKNIPKVFTGLCKEVGAILVNALNMILSSILTVTRGLATLLNFGYSKGQIEKTSKPFSDSTNVGLAVLVSLDCAGPGPEFIEENIHQNTVTM